MGRVFVENNSISNFFGNRGDKYFEGAFTLENALTSDESLTAQEKEQIRKQYIRGDGHEDPIKAILENNPGSDTIMALIQAKDTGDYALAVLSSLPMERALAVLGKLSKAFKTTEKIVSPEIAIKNPSSKLPSNTKSQSSSDVWKPNDSKINAGEYQVSNGSPNAIDKGNLANPITQSRINVQNGDSKAGWEHVIKRHFSGNSNASQFTISESELKSLLQNPEVVKIPISKTQMSLNKATGKEEILYQRTIILDKKLELINLVMVLRIK